MTDTDMRERFEVIVAALDARPRCGETNRDGLRCRRVASWHVTLHGHSHTVMCTQHLNGGLRWAHLLLAERSMSCRVCGRRDFVDIDDVVTAARL